MSARGRREGGRGAYYKARYGGGGRGRGRGGQDGHASDSAQYGFYKQLLGKYSHTAPNFILSVDHVQGDPYASPSKVRSIVPWAETGFPKEYHQSHIRRTALCDFVSRVAGSLIQAKHLDRNVGNANGGWSGPKGGAFSINMPGQEILPRTSALISGTDSIELRFTVSLPAAGRTILGEQAYKILAVNLVEIVKQSLLHVSLDQRKLQEHIASAEAQESLRLQLQDNGLLAFIANGSVLPRASGASQAPMTGHGLVSFKSPKELEVSLISVNGRSYTGMGIPRGVILLTGGGFHGKSTLLEALELGIYNHIPGDGREGVVTDPTAFKIRAEDGRNVSKTDISPFISKLPGGKGTTDFSTEDASGSTSMSANIQEALEAGCRTLLIDEDSSATNLLVRDARMQALIQNEPITPLISKARALFNERGASTVIVIGGLGDWLSVADCIIAMDSYVPRDITQQAKEISNQFPSSVNQDRAYGSIPKRRFRVDFEGLRTPYASRKKFITLKPEQRDAVDDPSRAESGIDVGSIDQIVEKGQSQMIATLLQRASRLTGAQALTLQEMLEGLEDVVGIEGGLPTSLVGGDLVAIRPLELGAALSRVRGLALRVDEA
ncbi:Hypothetical predicted protein [Lecanosticta acicola]|uniref:Uncharacterized protein n=1 Tax=Lecanosticta acicola TaxID=111012 RepID=A0AAI8YYB2_9PEZI|nr:Hypothetical predicted protein [Lecanosticta acicola]